MKQEFDNKLREGLENYSSDVDLNELWAALEPTVDAINDKDEKRRKPFFWLLCLGLGLGLFGAGIWWMQTDTFLDQQAKYTKTIDTQKTIPKNKYADDAKIKKNHPVIESAVTSKLSTTDISTSESHEKAVEDVSFSLAAAKNNKRTNYNINTPKITSQTASKNQNYIGETPISKTINSSKTSPYILSNSRNQSVDLQKEQTTQNKVDKETVESSRLDASLSFVRSDLQSIPAVNFSLSTDEDLSSQLAKMPNIVFEKEEDTPRNRRRRKRRNKDPFEFAVGMQSAVSLANRKLSTKATEATDYLQIRENTERSLETMDLGLTLDLAHRSGVELSTGLQVTQITEKFDYQEVRVELDTIENGLYGYQINANGDTTKVYDQIINTKETTYNKEYFNRYRMVDIPLLVGYSIALDDWSVGVQAGVIANLKLKTSGLIFDYANDFVDIAEEQEKFFKDKVGMSFQLGAIGRYALTDNIQILASPFFRFYPKSFTVATYELDQNYSLLGCKIGARIRF